MKKLLLTTALIAAPALAFANEGSHFQAGLYGGYVGSSTHAEAHNTSDPAVTLACADLGGSGGQVGLMLGYNYMMDSGLMVGADLFGQFGSHEATHQNPDVTLIAKQKHAFGAALKMGYNFDSTMAYFRVGYINSRFDLSQIKPIIVAGPPATFPGNTVENSNLGGLLIGVGADMPAGEMMTVGISYDFSMYKSEDLVNADHGNAEFKPRTHAFNVVLKYKF